MHVFMECNSRIDITPKAIATYKYHKNRIYPYACMAIISMITRTSIYIRIAEFIINIKNEGRLS
jgi:hypothetical protein